jgi:hypothetical protein
MSASSSSASSGASYTDAPAGDVRYTLPDFQQYLVLERAQCASSGSSRDFGKGSDKVVLVPAGQVVHNGVGVNPAINLSDSAQSRFQVRTPVAAVNDVCLLGMICSLAYSDYLGICLDLS